MKRITNISEILVILVLALAMAACGDDTQASGEFEGREAVDVTRPDEQPPTPDTEPEPEALLLEAVSDTTHSVEIRETVELEVALVTDTSRAPVGGEEIGFTILQAPSTAVSLSSRAVETNEDGRAAVSVEVGEEPGQVLIRATYPDVAPVEFTIEVGGLPDGDIEVGIFLPSQAQGSLAPYRVRAYDPADVTCQTFPRRADLSGFVEGNEVSGTLTTLTDLPSERNYTVTVQAMGTSQAAIAWGCLDDVEVLPRETTEVSISLNLVPLNPTGTYEVLGYWNIAEAIRASGGAGSIIVGLIDFLSNPGLFVYDLVINEIQNAVSFDIITFLQIAGIPTLVQDTINGWLFQNEDLARFNDIAIGLQTMLNQLEVHSELVIDKLEPDFSFTGREEWKKVVLNLSWRCDATSPPDCGRYEIPVDASGNISGLGHVRYDWEGQVVDYDGLELESLAATIDYGGLMVTIIEEVVIPELTGGNANSIAGAFSHWIDCPGLAAQIAGCASGTCLGAQVVQGACNAAITSVVNQVVGPLQAQSVILDLEFDGTGTLNDSEANGFVDQILEGRNLGTMVDTGAPVDVDWTAELVNP